MTHRGVSQGHTERPWLRKLSFELAGVVVIGAVLTVLFIVGDLLVYGRVNW